MIARQQSCSCGGKGCSQLDVAEGDWESSVLLALL